mmetsp:Transcript_25907/g.40216  ORF Transcript_25907/g.40216 Transcript_25907/m.40216 type:complete len:286 (-) Transcript_25907:28-885(-)
MAPRPGVKAAKALAQSTDETKWAKIDRRYPEMIKSTGGEKLEQLQKQLDDLSVRFTKKQSSAEADDNDSNYDAANRTIVPLSKDEFMSVVQWKFAKGKDRSAFLMKHLTKNSDAEIQDSISTAFEIADTIPMNSNDDDNDHNDSARIIKNSIKALTKLKGVGPATASAFLCLYRPDIFCFMDDEVIETFCGKRVYTLKVYVEMNEECRRVARTLGNDNNTWSVYRVGRALWTSAKLSAFGCDVDDADDDSKADDKEERTIGIVRSSAQTGADGHSSGGRKRRKRA